MRCIFHRDQYIYQCSLEFELLDAQLSYIEGSIDITLQNITAKERRDKEECIEYDENQTAYCFNGLVLPDSIPIIFSRFIYNNYFLSLWATYENSLEEIADFLVLANSTLCKYSAFKKKGPKEIAAKERPNFITTIFRYFKEIHKIDIPTVNPFDQDYLYRLCKIRNNIAHENGRFKDQSDEDYLYLKDWMQHQTDISVSQYGWILFNKKFCRDIHQGLSYSFKNLCRLAYEAAPNNDPYPVEAYRWHY